MGMLTRIILVCSYMVGLVLVIAWTIAALSDIDASTSRSIILALASVVTCGVGVGLVSLKLSASRRDRAKPAGIDHPVDGPSLY